MRDDIELQIRTLQLRLQLRDASDELACVADVVLSPVVRKDVERVLVAVSSRIIPVTIAITGVATQRHQQVSIDVHLRQHAREFYRLDDLSRYEIVTIGCEIGTDRQSFLRGAKCGRPNRFPRLRIHQLRSENSGNHYHWTLSGPGSDGCEDVFEIGSATRGDAAARNQRDSD